MLPIPSPIAAPARFPVTSLPAAPPPVWPSLGAGRRAPRTCAPSDQAVRGALDIYLGGWRTRRIREVLFGLAVLRDATGTQVDDAIRSSGAAGSSDAAGIRRLFLLGDIAAGTGEIRG